MKTLLFLVALFTPQDAPQDIAKKDLPKAAPCVVCTAGGEGHGDEKPAAGVMYKGKAYYFCNAGEVKGFKADPEAFMPPVLPRPMPAFALSDTSGKQWNAESMKEKLVLIDYWATWCKPCIDMFPKVDKLREKYNARGFEVLSVSIDESKEALDRFLARRAFANPVIHDRARTWSAWGVRAIPAMFLVRDGQIVAQWTGKVTESALSAAIEANLPK